MGVLVGTGICPKLAEHIQSGGNIISNDGIKISFSAIVLSKYKSSHGSIYVTSDVHFNTGKNTKDTTKYIFKRGTYCKGRLVLAIVNKYIEENIQINLLDTFTMFKKNTLVIMLQVYI